MKQGLKFLVSALVGGILTVGATWADTVIPIANPSFEITNPLTTSCGPGCAYNDGPIPDWTVIGGQSGTQMLNSTYYSAPVPDGTLMAYSNGSTISQTLSGVTLNPDSTYTLSVYIGDRLDNVPSNYSFSLEAGSTILTTFSGYTGNITPGTWQQEFLTYTTGDTVPSGDITILLTSAGTQTDFDDVSLTDPPANTPEPGSVWMLGAGLLGLLGIAVPRSLKA